MAVSQLAPVDRLEAYRSMLTVRRFEERVRDLRRADEFAGLGSSGARGRGGRRGPGRPRDRGDRRGPALARAARRRGYCGGRGRTNRVLIAHEANVTGGFGAEIAAFIGERHFDAPVRRVGAPDVRLPAAPALQAALLPSADSIARAAERLALEE